MVTSEDDVRVRLRDHMAGLLETWAEGYTEPFPDGEQRKVEPVEYLEDGLVVVVRTLSLATSGADRKFRVRLNVEEIR